MNALKKSYVLNILLLSLLVAPFIVGAQTESLSSDVSIPSQIPELKEQISIDISPQIPKPLDEVTITAAAYGTDLNRATLTWSVNGKQILKGTGEKVFIFQVGDVGSKSVVTLHIEPVGGGAAIDKTFNFAPAEVDLLWESNTYTPPFYKGKALFSPEAELTFVAMPNILSGGSRVSPTNAINTWKLDYRVQGDKSGYGKNVFKYTGSIILKSHNIRVESYSSNNPDAKAVGSVDIDNQDPQALLYEDHPLYGILFNRALTDQYYLTQGEVKLAVMPYNFSTGARSSNISYAWTLNDSPIQAPTTESLMTLRKNSTLSGQATVAVSITSPDKILQAAVSRLAILFGTGGTFGQ